jgi:Protein of unknown function (DUF4058)
MGVTLVVVAVVSMDLTMPSPFPGMDPYLEKPAFWASFHSRMIVALADAIAPSILPRYYIEVEARTYGDEVLVGIPDAVVLSRVSRVLDKIDRVAPVGSPVALANRPQQVELPVGDLVKERYLEVREVGSDRVITVIELLSPKNKRAGKGRVAYEDKRSSILSSTAHLIEIDLLRGNLPMPIVGEDGAIDWDYRILVSRSQTRPMADLYGFMLHEAIPSVPLPLGAGEAEPMVDLQAIFVGVYDRAGYEYRIDYQNMEEKKP